MRVCVRVCVCARACVVCVCKGGIDKEGKVGRNDTEMRKKGGMDGGGKQVSYETSS